MMVDQGKRIGPLIVLAAFLCFFPTSWLFGQNSNAGEIRGTVTDSSGAVIPGTVVTITGVQTGVTLTVLTDSTGIYDALSVQPGEYVLTFTKPGFRKLVHSPITLRLEIVTVDAQLQVGGTAQQITVQAKTPLLQTESSEHSTTVTSTGVTELPDVGNSWFRLTTLIPGNVGSADNIAVNGQRGYDGSFLMDGGNATFTTTQSAGEMAVPNDAISEIKFTTGNFGAEYGNGSASYNVITKSGTNQFHGSAFEYIQNNIFDSSNYFSNLYGEKVPYLRADEYGGSIGGPIKKNKAFFFFSFDRNPYIYSGAGTYSYPTAAMRQGDFSSLLTQSTPTIVYDPYSLNQVDGQWVRTPLENNVMTSSQIDPVTQKIESYLPLPNLPGLTNNYYYNGRSSSPESWFNERVDINLRANNRLNASFLTTPQEFNYDYPMSNLQDDHFKIIVTNGQVSDVWTLNPTMVNEFRMAGVDYNETGASPSVGKGYPQQLGLESYISDIFPQISIGEGIGGSGISPGIHTRMGEGSFIPSDILTWIKGKHIMKFGGEYDWWYYDESCWGDMSSGSFDFAGAFTDNPSGSPAGTQNGLGYADFLFGLPVYWGASVSPIAPWTGMRMQNTQLFANDDYKIRPNLTLNLGLRWQYQGGWTEDHNRLGSFDPNLMNPATGTLGALWYAGQDGHRALQNGIPDVFAPRLGFAWSPRKDWVVRGGYGFYDILWGAGNYQYSGGGVYGYSIQGSLTSTDQLTPVFTMGATPAAASTAYPNLAQGPVASAIIYPTAATRTPSLLNGQGINYSPFNTPMSYTMEGQFSVQHQMGPNTVVKAAYLYTRGVHLTYDRDLNQVPQSKLAPGDTQLSRPYPQYQGINANFSDGISNYDAFQLSVQRYFSRALTFQASYTFSKSLDDATGSGWGFGVDNWQISADPMSNYGLSANDETHLLSGALVYELPFGTGKHFLDKGGILNGVVGGWQISSMFRLNSGPPFTPVWGGANMSGALAGALYPDRGGNGTVSNPSMSQWFDTSAFADPAPYAFGNSGRNILRAPGYKDVDLALAKNFPLRMLGEAGRLQIRIDATNAFNFTNWSAPDNAIGQYGAGMIWSVGSMRQAQLGARLTF